MLKRNWLIFAALLYGSDMTENRKIFKPLTATSYGMSTIKILPCYRLQFLKRQLMQEDEVVLPLGYFEGCEASVTVLTDIILTEWNCSIAELLHVSDIPMTLSDYCTLKLLSIRNYNINLSLCL